MPHVVVDLAGDARPLLEHGDAQLVAAAIEQVAVGGLQGDRPLAQLVAHAVPAGALLSGAGGTQGEGAREDGHARGERAGRQADPSAQDGDEPDRGGREGDGAPEPDEVVRGNRQAGDARRRDEGAGARRSRHGDACGQARPDGGQLEEEGQGRRGKRQGDGYRAREERDGKRGAATGDDEFVDEAIHTPIVGGGRIPDQ